MTKAIPSFKYVEYCPVEHLKNWMFENKNGDLLRNKVSDYFTKVVEDGHRQGRDDNYTPPPSSPKTFFLGKQNIPEAAVTPDVNILNEDPKDIPARTAWNNTIFRKVDGQYQIYQDACHPE